MENEEFSAEDMIYLTACMVNGKTPDAKRVEGMNTKRLLTVSELHLLTGLVGYALEAAGVKDAAFIQAKSKAIRKEILFDAERKRVLQALDDAGIWYMPLKGSILKEMYPKIGMRQMADNDILYDSSKSKQVRTIMEGLGFETVKYVQNRYSHDHYYKPPVCNFEMHRSLFSPRIGRKLNAYYEDVRDILIKDVGNVCGYHFSDEEFYLYMIAHEFWHFSNSGTGLRSILDVYVYLKNKGKTLDTAYILNKTRELGISDFERANRSLAMHLFGAKTLTKKDEKMLEYILFSGTYGTNRNLVRNQLIKRGRAGYLLFRTFPPYYSMTNLYPILAIFPILLPACWVLRIITALISKRSRVIYQLQVAFRNLE